MPLFVIEAWDKPDSLAVRLANRPVHLDRMKALGAALVIAGPYLDAAGQPIGSLIIVDMESQAAVEAWAAADPYAEAGLFASVTVRPWRQSLPEA
ncbi:YciI family protein [Parapedomonas caeni]